MDAIEFLKERRRMCNAQDGCSVCPINTVCGDYFVNHNYSQEKANDMVTIVEQWAKEHQVKTRQSEFLKMFPNALMDGQVLNLCPKGFEGRTDCTASYTCVNCRRDYWLQEVE